MFGDELLVRAASGMMPTPKALKLIQPLRAALAQLQSAVSSTRTFDPETCDRVFHIGLPDSVEFSLGPHLLSFMRKNAPKMKLRLYSANSVSVLREIDADRIHLAIAFAPVASQQIHHKIRTLSSEPYVCIYSPEQTGITHPYLSLDDYLKYPHVVTSAQFVETGIVESILAATGRSRETVLTTSRFVTVPSLVASAPVIATMHSMLANALAPLFALQVSKPPLALPHLDVCMLWHGSYDQDPEHRWMRRTIQRLAASLEQD